MGRGSSVRALNRSPAFAVLVLSESRRPIKSLVPLTIWRGAADCAASAKELALNAQDPTASARYKRPAAPAIAIVRFMICLALALEVQSG
jgi:hypothetical protein